MAVARCADPLLPTRSMLVGHRAVWTISGIPVPDLGVLRFPPAIAVPWRALVRWPLLGMEVGSPSLVVMLTKALPGLLPMLAVMAPSDVKRLLGDVAEEPLLGARL